MYQHRKSRPNRSSLKINMAEVGEPIETKIARMKANQEPIGDEGVPIQFTERKDGVLPQMDIRTPKMEMALDAVDVHSRSKLAKRQERIDKENKEAQERLKEQAEKNAGSESTQATT